MIIILKPKTAEEEIRKLTEELEVQRVKVNPVIGAELVILGLVSDTSKIDPLKIGANNSVEKVMHVQEPFKKANRLFRPNNTIVNANGSEIGASKIVMIAGPCSVEGEEQITFIANEARKLGVNFLRDGAFKPRTSPCSSQGLEYDGLGLLKVAGNQTGLPIVIEIMSPYDVEIFGRDIDVIQVGVRNMQNFGLLKELGKTNKPALLKGGLSATIEELLMSAEYIMAGGNGNVILCERGVRTFETYTRNTLGLSTIPAIKKLSRLLVIVDPSHAIGKRFIISLLVKAAIAVGADGPVIGVHNDPAKALCDGPQSIKPEDYGTLFGELKAITAAVGREI